MNGLHPFPPGYHIPTIANWQAAEKKVITRPGVVAALVVLFLVKVLLLYVAQRVYVVKVGWLRRRARVRMEAVEEGGDI